MEQFNLNTPEWTTFNSEQLERQNLLLRQWDIEAFEWLEELWDIDATRDIVSSIAWNNTLFSEIYEAFKIIFEILLYLRWVPELKLKVKELKYKKIL